MRRKSSSFSRVATHKYRKKNDKIRKSPVNTKTSGLKTWWETEYLKQSIPSPKNVLIT